MKGENRKAKKMGRLVKRISEYITIPDEWTFDPKNKDGESILENPKDFQLGGGKVLVYSMSAEDFATARDRASTVTIGGSVGVHTSEKKMREGLFSYRLGGKDGKAGRWEGFYNEDDLPLNATEKNQKRFAWDEGLYHFVCVHVGPILDNIAEGKATEEEKNSLKLLVFTAGNESGSTGAAVKPAKKGSTKE